MVFAEEFLDREWGGEFGGIVGAHGSYAGFGGFRKIGRNGRFDGREDSILAEDLASEGVGRIPLPFFPVGFS